MRQTNTKEMKNSNNDTNNLKRTETKSRENRNKNELEYNLGCINKYQYTELYEDNEEKHTSSSTPPIVKDSTLPSDMNSLLQPQQLRKTKSPESETQIDVKMNKFPHFINISQNANATTIFEDGTRTTSVPKTPTYMSKIIPIVNRNYASLSSIDIIGGHDTHHNDTNINTPPSQAMLLHDHKEGVEHHNIYSHHGNHVTVTACRRKSRIPECTSNQYTSTYINSVHKSINESIQSTLINAIDKYGEEYITRIEATDCGYAKNSLDTTK